MSEHPIEGLMGTTMQKIREMIDVNTVIGDPVSTQSGTTIIPVSKVSLGFGAGGSDFPSKNPVPKDLFGGGGGAGISIQPIAFLIVSAAGDVKLIQISTSSNTADKVVNLVPDMIDKFGAFFSKEEKKEEQAAEEKQL